MSKVQAVYEFLNRKGWLVLDDMEEQVAFLAAGEYNENYLVTASELYGESRYVFRINHGSQLGLNRQIEYEFQVLQTLARSGVTPRPFYCDASPGDEALGQGVLLMEYFPGRPMDYATDWRGAAAAFAAVHAQPVDDRLIVQRNPVADICRESEGLLRRYPDHPLSEVRDRLLAYRDEIAQRIPEAEALYGEDPLVVVNTEVNSHNFLVDDDATVRLVDWEKAVVSSRYQDIGHFLVSTTTLWRTDYRFSMQGKERFVAEYLDRAELGTPLEKAIRMTELMERAILLRALSWCFMAHYEYTQADRPLKSDETFAKITAYLDDVECFLKPES